MKWLICMLILKPLILRDYRMRREGIKPDEMYWADKQALVWGYLVTPDGTERLRG